MSEAQKSTTISVGGDVKGSVVAGDHNKVENPIVIQPWWQRLLTGIVSWFTRSK